MKRKIAMTISVPAVIVAAALALSTVRPANTGPAVSDDAEPTKSETNQLAERGKYLVSFGGCHDCHSPKNMTDRGPVPDMTRALSGHPEKDKLSSFHKDLILKDGWVLFSPDLTSSVGPWGVVHAMNLTPDDNTGIGLWTKEMFVNAMRTGKHMGSGRPIMPPMPWMNLNELTDEDLEAIYAYLRTLPPVKNAVPGPMSLDDYLQSAE